MAENEEESDQVVNISEFIEGMDAQQLEADLVLGGDEGKECTYQKGIMRRQAVFSCLTCTPNGNAGFCTACSLVCHDGHEVVELWTRRGFRCDCGNDKFGTFECSLLKDKEPENKANVYNQNYSGMYCTCHRPFPDPDPKGASLGEMLQCCICEDWFHETHLGLSPTQEVPRDDEGEPSFDELLCQSCAARCSFLSYYPDLVLQPGEVADGEDDAPLSGSELVELSSTVVVQDSELPIPGPSELGSSGDTSNSDSSRSTPASDNSESFNIRSAFLGGRESSRGAGVRCKLKLSSRATAAQLQTAETAVGVDSTVANEGAAAGQAVFLAKPWRAELCRCEDCLAMYASKGVGFLMEREDTIQEYEETAKRRREEVKEREEVTVRDFMQKLGHVQKMELLLGYNHMASELGAFLGQFREDEKTVTSEDIYGFFENLQQKRRRMQ